jgi:uncharacterized short protein YbdD (DUF466 family)
MSTETDQIFAAGLYNMMKGVRADWDAEEKIEAELAREEGMARLSNRMRNESSPSGYVMKDTGRPISQKELANIPQDQRVTQGDFQIGQQEKQYTAEQEWTRQAREDALTRGIEQEKRGYAADLEKEQARQSGMTKREKMKQEAAAAKEASKVKSDGMSQKEMVRLRRDIAKDYQGYKEKVREFDPEASVMSKKEWLRDFDSDLYRILYGDEGETAIANGESKTGAGALSALEKLVSSKKKEEGAKSLEKPSHAVETPMVAEKKAPEKKAPIKKPKMPSSMYAGMEKEPLPTRGKAMSIETAATRRKRVEKIIEGMTAEEKKRFYGLPKAQQQMWLASLL